jgi:threonine aldolase
MQTRRHIFVKTIDLRSDTVTVPTPAMRKAMYEAELGDDVYGEDPTVNRLEDVAAEMLGKEAALLTVSGTMSNLVALLTHTGRGDEVIMGDKAHTFLYEVGGPAALGSITTRVTPNQADGTLNLVDIEKAVRPLGNDHFPRTKLVVIENTHNRMGGAVLPVAYCDSVGELARRYHLKAHMDGARIFNAAVSLGVHVNEIARSMDSICFCLSKGLACPVGSVLAGTQSFIDEARRYRKMVGGGMRQAGVLAAAGLVALREMIDRLADDHSNARLLAEGLAGIPGIQVDLDSVQSNIVIFDLTAPKWAPEAFHAAMSATGVKFNCVLARQFRLVTHYGIDAGDIELALKSFRQVAASDA